MTVNSAFSPLGLKSDAFINLYVTNSQSAGAIRARQIVNPPVTRQSFLPVASIDFAALTPCLTVDFATLSRQPVRTVEKAWVEGGHVGGVEWHELSVLGAIRCSIH